MKIILFIVVLVLSYLFGVWGFCQIIGSIQHRFERSVRATVLTILIWIAILTGVFFLARAFFHNQMTAYYIGTGVSLLMTLLSGRIQ